MNRIDGTGSPDGPGGTSSGVRPAQVGELCTCGREALVVYTGGRFGATGHCGLSDGGAPVDGTCVFCGDAVDHDHYARAELAAGRETPLPHGSPQGGRCPLYRLRLSDPLPELHAESVRRFDPVTDREERAEGRLRQELIDVLIAAGADYNTGRYPLAPDPMTGELKIGDLEDVVFEIGWSIRQALGRDPVDVTSHDPAAGRPAVAVLLLLLGERLDDLGVTPNPLTGLDADTLVERAGGAAAWAGTVAHDRPLLIARRVARRALDPTAPTDIYRPHWT